MQKKEKSIQILLALVNDVECEGIKSIIAKANECTIIFESTKRVLIQDFITYDKPNLLLLDEKICNFSYENPDKWLNIICSQVKVIIIANNKSDYHLYKSFESGAVGYFDISKESGNTLIEWVKKSIQDTPIFSNEQLIKANKWRINVGSSFSTLTKREKQVLYQISQGKPNSIIAEELCISVKTIETYVGKILRKLNLNSRGEIISWVNKYLPTNNQDINKMIK